MSDKYDFNIKKRRPEEIYNNVSDYFRGEILEQYATSKSIMKTQEKITIRALELLNIKQKGALILDAGTGPGFTAMYLTEFGYKTVAIDILLDFLYFYDLKKENPIAADMCFPPFKPNIFDAIISISALQWIYRDIKNEKVHNLLKSLSKSFFQILKPFSQAIIQFYPKNKELMEKIGEIFTENTGFCGNFIIDNPNSPKKRKIYLLLKKRT
ncbi:MAG: class I SAM-dependent methyltransferase [Candidatus Hermodarchaeota archaeon]